MSNENDNAPQQDTALMAALRMGQALAAEKIDLSVTENGFTPYAVVPEGFVVKNLEEFATQPARIRESAVLQDVRSFCDYWKAFYIAGVSTIFADQVKMQFLAIIDYHKNVLHPAWKKHRATYACPLSVEWQTWENKNGVQMKQADFAAFIEDNLPDVIRPIGAEFLEVARSLEAKKNVKFASSVRLDNGQSELSYEEDIKGTSAKGRLEIPQSFTILIPVFINDTPVTIDARLRYRINDGALVMWYDLHRPHIVLQDAFKRIVTEIETQTGVAALLGAES